MLVPGNHSDVGGGYLDGLDEKIIVARTVMKDVCKKELSEIQKKPVWKKLIDSINIKNNLVGYCYAISTREKLNARLQWVYAQLMIEIAIKNKCEFDLANFTKINEIPSELEPIYNQLLRVTEELNGVMKCEDLFQINRDTIDSITDKYIHISANWYIKPKKANKDATRIKSDNPQIGSKLPDDFIHVYRPSKDWVREIIFK